MSNSVFNYDNTLPGVITEIDSHLSSDYDTSLFGTTDSICIIGTAFDGPVGLPSPIYSVDHAMYVFGRPYDPKTRKETSLVTDIQEAWNKGCRTIYAMRINGIDMYKDFDFCVDNGMKLRIQSRYPSNLGKQCYIKYDNIAGAESFTIYKPACRATVKEKMNGLVENENAVMTIKIDIGLDYGMKKETKLIDVIEIINTHVYNNVLELAIVNEKGDVVTDSPEAYDLTLGDVFPGVYFIGRSHSKCAKVTDVRTSLVLDKEDEVPYSGFNKKYFKTLVMNTDVSLPVPVYYSSLTEMRTILSKVGILINKEDDYLEIADESAKAFAEDSKDYEETSMNAFEKYMRLGSGFATTAIAERREDGNHKELIPRIKESALDDPLHIINTGDGIYSIMEDTRIKYHVLGHDVCANTVIGGKMPKHDAFKTTVAESVELMNGLISAVRKIDSDNAYHPQSYNFMIYNYKDVPKLTKEKIYTDRIVEIIGYASKLEDITSVTDAKPGEKCLFLSPEDTDGTKNVLYVANENGAFEETQDKLYAGKNNNALYLAGYTPVKCSLADSKLKFEKITDGKTETGNKDFVIMQEKSNLFITDMSNYQVKMPFMATAEVALDPENDEDLFVYYQDHSIGNNHIMISYPHFDTTTLTDFVELLNKSVLSKIFDFRITQTGMLLKDEYVEEADKKAAKENSSTPVLEPQQMKFMAKDRTRGYDYSKHIPYTTTDNFARHLAQHCQYTELKTFPTHGIIGCERVTDVSKTNIAKLVSDLKSFNWSMYAKNNYGRNMLNENNLPYSIGRQVSVVCMQEPCVINNYSTILNGAAAYAGMVSNLPINKSSTAQSIDLVPMFEFSRSQLQVMSVIGIITARNSFTKGYVITDGITMAPEDDLLRRLFNTRVMQYTEDLIRAACEPFIGTGNTLANRNSLQTAIKSKLTPLLGELLRSFDFKIADDGSADQYTYIDINYVIVPVNEIREIRNYVKVQNK